MTENLTLTLCSYNDDNPWDPESKVWSLKVHLHLQFMDAFTTSLAFLKILPFLLQTIDKQGKLFENVMQKTYA